MRSEIRWILVAAVLGGACGDDDASGDWQPFADKCATPRTGVSPFSGRPYADTQGTLGDEKTWLREWTHDLYLWYREVPDTDPDDEEERGRPDRPTGPPAHVRSVPRRGRGGLPRGTAGLKIRN